MRQNQYVIIIALIGVVLMLQLYLMGQLNSLKRAQRDQPSLKEIDRHVRQKSSSFDIFVLKSRMNKRFDAIEKQLKQHADHK